MPAFIEQNKHYINKKNQKNIFTLTVKMWEHEDTADSTGELIHNRCQKAPKTIKSFSYRGLATREIC